MTRPKVCDKCGVSLNFTGFNDAHGFHFFTCKKCDRTVRSEYCARPGCMVYEAHTPYLTAFKEIDPMEMKLLTQSP